MATKGGSGVQVKKNKSMEDIMRGLDALSSLEVLVGFPEATTERKEDEEDEKKDLTNAALGYIHDNGSPEVNIPARPFMAPGITAVKPKLIKIAKKMAKQVMEGQGDSATIAEQGYHAMGLVAQASIRNVINEGVAPPLADSTLRARAKKGSKGAKEELENRAKGLPPGMDLAKPLIVTGQLRNAVNYAVRNRKKRSG